MNISSSMSEQEFLSKYDLSKYPRPSVTVDSVLFSPMDGELRVLLVQRGGHPYLGKWALPGGFLRSSKAVAGRESLDDAVVREVFEETGVHPVWKEQLYTYGDVDRDPRGHIVSVAYISCVSYAVSKYPFLVKAGDDAAEARWFVLGNNIVDGLTLTDSDNNMILASDLAFDHVRILRDAIERVANKMLWTDVILNFVNNQQQFMIREVYDIFSQFLSLAGKKPMDKGNFYRDFERRYGDFIALVGTGSYGAKMYARN